VTTPAESVNASQALTVDSEPPPSTGGATLSPEPVADRASYSFLAPPQAADELGRLGAYRALKVLGQGGMGIVFVGEDVRLGRQVALKAMLPELATRPAARICFPSGSRGRDSL
jgi:serine/threonine protein kinase